MFESNSSKSKKGTHNSTFLEDLVYLLKELADWFREVVYLCLKGEGERKRQKRNRCKRNEKKNNLECFSCCHSPVSKEKALSSVEQQLGKNETEEKKDMQMLRFQIFIGLRKRVGMDRYWWKHWIYWFDIQPAILWKNK